MGARTIPLITDVLGAYPPDMRIINPYSFATLGGGPDAWYDAISAASTTDDNSCNNAIMIWCKVPVGASGTATKLRIYTVDFAGAGDVKMALYTSGGVLMDSGIVTVTAANQYWEVTLDDGESLSATDYYVAWQPDAALAVDWRYTPGFTSGDLKYISHSYASFPPANLPGGENNLDWRMAVGIFAD